MSLNLFISTLYLIGLRFLVKCASIVVDIKLKTLEVYISEIRDFTHPRSEEFIRLNSKLWEVKAGLTNTEVFQGIRIIK